MGQWGLDGVLETKVHPTRSWSKRSCLHHTQQKDGLRQVTRRLGREKDDPIPATRRHITEAVVRTEVHRGLHRHLAGLPFRSAHVLGAADLQHARTLLLARPLPS